MVTLITLVFGHSVALGPERSRSPFGGVGNIQGVIICLTDFRHGIISAFPDCLLNTLVALLKQVGSI